MGQVHGRGTGTPAKRRPRLDRWGLRRWVAAAGGVVLSLAGSAPLRAQGDDGPSRRTLAGLRQVAVLVDSVGADAQSDGLTSMSVQAMVVTDLMGGGLTVAPTEAFRTGTEVQVRVRLHVLRTAGGWYVFSTSVQLNQFVTLARNRSVGAFANTWESATAFGALRAESLGKVRDEVRRLTRQFLDAYRAANPQR